MYRLSVRHVPMEVRGGRQLTPQNLDALIAWSENLDARCTLAGTESEIVDGEWRERQDLWKNNNRGVFGGKLTKNLEQTLRR